MRSLSVVSLLVCGAADVPWLDTSAEAPERTPPAPEVYARKDEAFRRTYRKRAASGKDASNLTTFETSRAAWNQRPKAFRRCFLDARRGDTTPGPTSG